MENGHANDCEQGSKTVGTMDDYTRKLMSMAKTTKDAHVDNKPCKWYLFGLCQFQTQCELVHDKGVPPNMIGCALPREKKHKLLKLGLPEHAMVCIREVDPNGVCMPTRSGDQN